MTNIDPRDTENDSTEHVNNDDVALDNVPINVDDYTGPVEVDECDHDLAPVQEENDE